MVYLPHNVRRLAMFIYEDPQWPKFVWNTDSLVYLLSKARNMQGKIIGKMGVLGFELRNQANLEMLTLDVLKSSEIEGEMLDSMQVRSSIARRLGLDIHGLTASDRNVDGVVDMMMDATVNFNKNIDRERLFSWHSSLFPLGRSGMYKIAAGKWRDDSRGPMQVVSGPFGKETVHYEAPPAQHIDKEMNTFFDWLNSPQNIDTVLKAAIAHLWFVTLHPFEDGNGRIARAITDMLLARSDEQPLRFYSMSTQIRKERSSYYQILEKSQKDSVDITEWLEWFLNCLIHALDSSELLLNKVVKKHDFWNENGIKIENDRQRKMLNMLMDNFEGNLTTSKWAKICRCSQDTALRDIQDLVGKNILQKLPSSGRSTCYDFKIDMHI